VGTTLRIEKASWTVVDPCVVSYGNFLLNVLIACHAQRNRTMGDLPSCSAAPFSFGRSISDCAPFKGRMQRRKAICLQIREPSWQCTAGPYKSAKTGLDILADAWG
jgi:hypothetical protein